MLANKLKIGDTIGVIAPDKALKNKDIKYLENQEFKLSGKQYKCIGNTLYINVSVY